MTDIEDKNIIYIVKEAEQVRNGENIYKIGMTRKGMYKRLQGYRKGTETMFFLDIGKIDCGYFEKRVIKRFKTLFIQRLEFGNEYFQGSFNQMMFSVTNEFMLMNISVTDANNELVEEEKILEHFEFKCKYDAPPIIKEHSKKCTDEYNKLGEFVKLNLKKSNDFITMKDIKDLIKNDDDFKIQIKTGNGLRKILENTLQTVCIDQKKINKVNYRNVFMNWSKIVNEPILEIQ